MWEKVGKAEVEVRVKPRHLAELREYVAREYGPGTEPWFLLREAFEGTRQPRHRVRHALKRIVRALAKAVGAQPSGNGRRPGGGSTETAR